MFIVCKLIFVGFDHVCLSACNVESVITFEVQAVKLFWYVFSIDAAHYNCLSWVFTDESSLIDLIIHT